MPPPASTPTTPTSHQRVFGRSTANDRTGESCVLRPMAISPTMMGRQISTMQARYTTTNAAPPPWPTRVGNPQILPRPTAAPAAAIMNPARVPQLPRAMRPAL